MADTLPHVKDCPHCPATKFYSKTKDFCCLEGRVVLANNELPDIFKQLLTSGSEEAKTFRRYIRTYNNLFAFTSLGVKSDANYSKRNNEIYTFRVQGQVYHFINDLLPENSNCKNLQLYFHDTEHELQNRLASCARLSEQAIEIILKTLPSQDLRVYNKPDVSQVAALWVDGDGDQENYYGCYDPLQYPLMFPFGEFGWHQGITIKVGKEKTQRGHKETAAASLISPQNAANAEDMLLMEQDVMAKKVVHSKYVSVREYYAYKLQIRKNDKSHILHFGRLLQQYIVDMYVKLETQRLDFFRSQQQEIRKEFLQGVVDAIGRGETEGSAVGKRIVLPSSFIGGPRNMRRKYIDAMTLVEIYGKPDILLTMTSNPNRPEVKEHLMKHEEAQNRDDLVVRVFHAKVEQLKEELFKNMSLEK